MLDNEKIIELQDLKKETLLLKNQGYRYITMSCVDLGDSFDLIYHFDKAYEIYNMRFSVAKGTIVPSLSDVYFCAMLTENELKDLFGLEFSGLVLDCGGNLLITDEVGAAPMTKQYVVKAKESE